MPKRTDDELLGANPQTPKQADAQEKLVKALSAICRLICEKHNYNPVLCQIEVRNASKGIENVLKQGVARYIRSNSDLSLIEE